MLDAVFGQLQPGYVTVSVPKLALLAIAACNVGCSTNVAHQQYTNFLVNNPKETQKILNSLADYQKNVEYRKNSASINALKNELYDIRTGRIIGDIKAKSTIIMFTDPLCRYCQTAIGKIMNLSSVKEGNINFLLREIPIINRNSRAVSRVLFTQPATEYLEFYEMASEGGFADEKALLAFLTTHQATERDFTVANQVIDKNLELAKQLAISSTPLFIYDSKFYKGLTPELLNSAR